MALGATGKAGETVMAFPLILVIVLVAAVPSGKTTLSDGMLVTASPVASSTVTTAVVADLIRPPLRDPARIGSLILITWPGRTTTPASIEAVKVTISVAS